MATSRRDALVAAVRAQREIEDAFVAAVTEAERGAAGSYERWSAAQLLAHVAFWRARLARSLAGLRAGTPVEAVVEFEPVNRQVWADSAGQPFTDAAADLDGAMSALLAELALHDDASLDQSMHEDSPAVNLVVGNTLEHATTHLAYWLVERDRVPEARALAEALTGRVLGVDPSERARGNALYNTACFHALTGEGDAALELLAAALTVSADLAEFARTDPDFRSLRDLPAFRDVVGTT